MLCVWNDDIRLVPGRRQRSATIGGSSILGDVSRLAAPFGDTAIDDEVETILPGDNLEVKIVFRAQPSPQDRNLRRARLWLVCRRYPAKYPANDGHAVTQPCHKAAIVSPEKPAERNAFYCTALDIAQSSDLRAGEYENTPAPPISAPSPGPKRKRPIGTSV